MSDPTRPDVTLLIDPDALFLCRERNPFATKQLCSCGAGTDRACAFNRPFVAATPDAGDASEDVLILDSETGEHVEAPAAYVAERMAGDASTSASEPLSEDAEALADVLTRAGLGTANGIARAILASDWLAAREAKARAEAGEQVAQAIDRARAEYGGSVNEWLARGWRGGMENAADIAREVTG